mmetsp:Transcript_16647/g.45778  ORF Transcript_16647/g.45778 Transcript_16647/m.45778 type:complete len:490 (-) Transcript_16647:212-1681(-)
MLRTLRFILLPILWKARAAIAKTNCVENQYNHNGTTNATLMLDCTRQISDLGRIPSDDVKRSAVAAQLSLLVNVLYEEAVGDGDNVNKTTTNTDTKISGFYYESEVDAVYVARVGDYYCAAAFRGTARFQPTDWWTNLKVEAVPLFPWEDNCNVHQGYYEAYTEFKYRQPVEDFLRTCRIDCPTCEVLLTGHSQGGGIAEIAAMHYLYDTVEYNPPPPYVITVGGMQSLGAGCSSLLSREQRCRWYHYIMAKEGFMGRDLFYDAVPFLVAEFLSPSNDDDNEEDSSGDSTYTRNGGVAFIGHEILVSDADPSAALYAGFDSHRHVDFSKLDKTGGAHLYTLYASVLEEQAALYEKATAMDKGENGNSSVISDGSSSNSGTMGGIGGNLTSCDGDNPSWFLPATGFSEGTLCNLDESLCGEGMICEPEDDGHWYLLGESWRFVCRNRTGVEQKDLKVNSGAFGLGTRRLFRLFVMAWFPRASFLLSHLYL